MEEVFQLAYGAFISMTTTLWPYNILQPQAKTSKSVVGKVEKAKHAEPEIVFGVAVVV